MSDSGMGLELELGIGSDTSLPVVDEAQLATAIRTILQDADLEQLSRRMIRKQLEAQFHMDLSHYKDTINTTILEVIEQQNQQQSDDDDDEDDDDDAEPEPSDDDAYDRTPRKKAKTAAAAKKKASPAKRKRAAPTTNGDKKPSNAFNMELALSPELAAVMGSDRMARPQIVKALWEYIREHALQDPSNKRLIVLDDTLRNVFQRDAFTMFTMNKFVKRHVRKPDDVPPGGWDAIPRDGVSSDEDEEKKPKKKAAPAKRKKKVSAAASDDDTDKPKRVNPFNTELAISPELAAVIGSDRMARPQIVKALWEYIHAHGLQDPADKRSILLDDTLRNVFQRDAFTMFTMNKFIKRHARKVGDVPPGGWDAIPRDGVSSDEDEEKKPKKRRTAASKKNAVKQE